MGNQNPNSTNYVHSYEPNTNDLTMAMDYNGEGKPAIRTLAASEVSTRSAFGELIAVPITPVIQIDALYGFDPREFELLTSGTGNTQQDTNKTVFRVHTGTGSYTIANETPLAEFVIAINGSGIFDLNGLELTIPPGDVLNIAVSSAQSISQIAAAINWAEV